MKDSNKTRDQLLAELHDLRARLKDAEEPRGESEIGTDLANIIVHESLVPIVVADTDQGIIIECNPAVEDLLEYPRDELIGMHYSKIAADSSLIPQYLQKLDANPDAPGFIRDAAVKTASGKIRYVNARANRIKHHGKRVTLAILRDITEQKQTQNALKISEARFGNLLDHVDMVSMQGYDSQRRVVYWNEASTNLYGYTREEAIGRKLEDLIIPDFMREDVITGVTNWVENGVPIPAGELDLMRKDGSLVHVYSSHVLQETSDHGPIMYCIDVDLSEVRENHNQLLQAKEEAEAANAAKSEFLANMSHEIRTPLNGVLGMLQLLAATRLDQEQNDYVASAIGASKRLSGLLSDILDLSRVEAGKMPINSEPVDIREIFSQLEELFMPISRQTGIRLSTIIAPGLTTNLMGDGTRLHQVLSNLVGNAFKFTSCGSITLEATPLTATRDGKIPVLFSVADTGSGISEDQLDALFAPFIQASTGLTRSHQGAGLGLTICKRLVDLMGGNMAVESEFGTGTTVYFTLIFDSPEVLCKARLNEKETQTLANTVLQDMHILLAEDEAVNSLFSQRILEKHGADITLAQDGLQALELLRQKQFDLILMDVQMPNMDGIEATRAIRRGDAGVQAIKTPIIALTAHAMQGDREEILQNGMDGYLAKPVDIQELLTVIGDIL